MTLERMDGTLTPRLREAALEDESFLEQLFIASHRDEFAPLGLDPAQLNSLLLMQARAQRLGYARDFPQATDWVILDADGTPVGRFLVDDSAGDIHLVDIALLPGVRNQGLGTELIESLKTKAAMRNVAVLLEVRPGNRAIHLYRRLGFQSVGGEIQVRMEYRASTEQSAGLNSATLLVPVDAAAPVLGIEWEARVGRRFSVAMLDGNVGPILILASMERNSSAPNRSFSLIFHGRVENFLPQGTYGLTPEDQDSPVEYVFLVPIGRDPSRMVYEAIFNL